MYSAWAPRAALEAEHPVADREGGDLSADRLHGSGELGPQDRHPWPGSPVRARTKKGLPARNPQGGAVHRRRVDLDQHLVVLGVQLVHLGDPDHVGGL